LSRLQQPGGGTELGNAIETVCAAGSRDILVLTDGQTWASEVHAAASRGCRISAVLVGSASLDAMVGHLASMTGGEVFYAQGRDVGPAVRSAIASMRSSGASLVGSALEGEPATVSGVRGGVRIEATWERTPTDQPLDAIGRYSASLALPLLDEQQATKLAVEHGLCSHLTSLLLLDEDGDACDGLPEMRQVPLAFPVLESCTASLAQRDAETMASFGSIQLEASMQYLDTDPISRWLNRSRLAGSGRASIDWDRLANALLAGDLSGLTFSQREAVRRLAQSKPVVDLAKAMGVDPVQIAVALLAEIEKSRMAQRLARRILRNAPSALLALAKSETMLTLNKKNGR
jgi:hypothetical protein